MKGRTRACIVVLAMIAMASWPVATFADVIYTDDFEAWPVGAYPAPPWQNMFSGASAFVSDLQARGGVHSFRSESSPGWARSDYVLMASIPDYVEYGGSVLLESAGRGCFLGFVYVDPNAPGTCWLGNTVAFDNDGVIRFYSRSIGSVALAPWTPGAWNDVRVQIDYTRLRAEVFVGGVLVGHELVTEPKVLMYYGVPVPLDKFGFVGNNFDGGGTGVHYLDGVTLSGGAVVPTRATTWGAVKGLYR